MDYFISRYLGACELLPSRLRLRALAVSEAMMAEAEEIRLRTGRAPAIAAASGEHDLDGPPVTPDDILDTLTRAARGSLHTFAGELAAGFLTAAGGYRLGVCGRAAMSGGECVGLREFSSLDLRISKEVRGAADDISGEICSGGRVRSTLIVSPPGGGKTTLLRDLVRTVSDLGFRVSLVDERGEIAACSGGVPGFDVGMRTDVLSGAPKAWSALTLLRAMNPQVLALDEITDPADARVLLHASGCGTAVFATVHAASPEEAAARPALARVIHIFEKAVLIERREDGRRASISDMPRRT